MSGMRGLGILVGLMLLIILTFFTIAVVGSP
jgi:hypothetical protein